MPASSCTAPSVFGDTGAFDPFLLLDDFRNDRPEDYSAGFPWHPHRGIETITYVLAGRVDHSDSLGNHGSLGPGDVQWMTAGSGILHQEMPLGDGNGRMQGFQLWANLPAALKMTAPRYQEIRAAEIPEVSVDGTSVKIICGDFEGRRGPVDGIAAEPMLLDVRVEPDRQMSLPVEARRRAFAYVFEGSGGFGEAADDRSLLQFGSGDEIAVRAGSHGIRFLLAAGIPIGEPVAWHGPIVMNTQAELQQALAALRDGSFIRQ